MHNLSLITGDYIVPVIRELTNIIFVSNNNSSFISASEGQTQKINQVSLEIKSQTQEIISKFQVIEELSQKFDLLSQKIEELRTENIETKNSLSLILTHSKSNFIFFI